MYSRALAVIGVTMDAQRASGMINNRVFEAMSVGAPLISEHFPALESLFGDELLYVRRPGDVAQHIECLLHAGLQKEGREEEANVRRRRRTMIETDHTWARRVEDMLSFAGSLPGSELATRRKGDTASRCSKQQGCLTLAIVVDPDLEGDITFESTFVHAVDLLRSTYRISWWMAPWDLPDGIRNDGGRTSVGDTTEKSESFEKRRRMQTNDAGHLHEYDIVWAAGRWGGPADRVVRNAFAPRTTVVRRSITPRLTAQVRGIVLWGSLCTPNNAIQEERESRMGDVDQQEGCPDFTGDNGLRWYDVSFCQTGWDHAFLAQWTFNGAVSNNLQQAWGFGSYAHLVDTGKAEMESRSLPTLYDILVVGTDNQIPDMLRILKASNLVRPSLAVIVAEGGADDRPELTSMLRIAGLEVGTGATSVDVTDLPQRLSLYVVDPSEGSTFTPRAVEVLLVRCTADVGALAKQASAAAKVVVVTKGKLGLWVTLVAAVHRRHHRGGYETQAIHPSEGGDRVQALVDQWPEAWDVNFYSRRLIAGMTRAFCLGRGNSRISLMRPAEGSATVVGVADTIAVEVLVENFDVGRDGQWCILAEGRTLLCVLQSKSTVDVHISASGSGREWNDALTTAGLGKPDGERGGNGTTPGGRHSFLRVELLVELRSNIYRDVLYRSNPAMLFIDPTGANVYRSGGECTCAEGDRVADRKKATERGERCNICGNHRELERSAYRTSIDVVDFIQASIIVELDVERIHVQDDA